MAFPIGFVTFKVVEMNDDTKKPSSVNAEDPFLSLETDEKGDMTSWVCGLIYIFSTALKILL